MHFYGEQIAEISLATELMILDGAEIPRDKQKQYTGRSQYPKIKYKPIIPTSKPNDICPHMLFWGLIRQNLAHAQASCVGGKDCQAEMDELSKMLGLVELHTEDLPEHLKAEASILGNMLKYAKDSFTFSQLLESIKRIHAFLSTRTCISS